MRFGKINARKEKFYEAKRPIKIWNVNVGNIIISNIVETKSVCKYLIGYLDEVIRPTVLMLPKMSGYVKTFEDEGEKG